MVGVDPADAAQSGSIAPPTAGRFGVDAQTIAELRELDLRYDRKSDGEFVHFYTRTVGSVFFEFVERREHYDGYGTAAASRGAAGGSAQRSLRLQQDLDRRRSSMAR